MVLFGYPSLPNSHYVVVSRDPILYKPTSILNCSPSNFHRHSCWILYVMVPDPLEQDKGHSLVRKRGMVNKGQGLKPTETMWNGHPSLPRTFTFR